MQEAFIQLVWQLGYFDKANWLTATGEKIGLYHPGRLNRDAGPDFKGARLKIGELDWHGDVELHLKASGWQQHGHQANAAYNSVVLHVVLEDDGAPAMRQDGTYLPVASLAGRILPELYQRYEQLQRSLHTIPCHDQIGQVSELKKLNMLDRSLMQRLERKAALIHQRYLQNNKDWEETTWQVLASGFGFKTNALAFDELSRRIPLKVLRRHASSQEQLEALLFGMSGLLQTASKNGAQAHPWVEKLLREWQLLAHKWQLQDKPLQPGQWLYARLRPANFPSLRLAQLAGLLFRQSNLFSFLMETPPATLQACLAVAPSGYWQTHYHFAKESKNAPHSLGAESIANLLINVVAPLRVAWGQSSSQQQLIDSAFQLLQSLPAENNRIIRYWKTLAMPQATAADSQALLELFNEFCTPKRCLQCTIGLAILKPNDLAS